MGAQPVDVVDSAQAIAMARAFLDANAYDRARDVVVAALARNPDNPGLLIELARVEICLGRPNIAAGYAHTALGYDPRNAYALIVYAIALGQLNRRFDAVQVAWQAVLASPNSAVTHRIYANLLHENQASEQALTVVAEALRLDPSEPESWLLRARILQRLGRTTESDAAFAEALRLRPDYASAVHDRALNQLRTGNLAGAGEGLVGAARLDPTLGNLARHNLGVAAALALRRVTLAATFAAITVLAAGGARGGGTSVVWRLCAGLGLAGVIILLVAASRVVPRGNRSTVLRSHPWVVVRLVHALLTAIFAALAAAVGGPAAVLAVGGFFLLASAVLIRVIGRLSGY